MAGVSHCPRHPVQLRDPKRVDRICRKLAILWHATGTDQRFGQLLINLDLIEDPEGTDWPTAVLDYQTEDTELEQELDRLLEEKADEKP